MNAGLQLLGLSFSLSTAYYGSSSFKFRYLFSAFHPLSISMSAKFKLSKNILGQFHHGCRMSEQVHTKNGQRKPRTYMMKRPSTKAVSICELNARGRQPSASTLINLIYIWAITVVNWHPAFNRVLMHRATRHCSLTLQCVLLIAPESFGSRLSKH